MSGATGGGFGTRIYFLPNTGVTADKAQIIKGSGYVTINLRGAHYHSKGTLWQKIFGGSDKVTLSTQITHATSYSAITSQSVEDVRKIDVPHPYYFGSNRAVALDLPADCQLIKMAVNMSAVRSDNLSKALDLLNSGELQSTLQLAPPAVSGALATAGVVKKLLSNTDTQFSLQGEYDGRLSLSPSDDPVRDSCLVQGTIILIYRESEEDTSLDNLDVAKLKVNADGLKYDGDVLENTYAMFQVSFTPLRGEDPTAPWYSIFVAADQALDHLTPTTSDSDKLKIWTGADAVYEQAEKLLLTDPTYTHYEASGIAATHYTDLQAKYAKLTGHPKPPALKTQLRAELVVDDGSISQHLERVASDYRARLSRANVSLPGHSSRPEG